MGFLFRIDLISKNLIGQITMEKVNVSTKNIGAFAGKWVVIDPTKEKIVAVGETLKDVESLITRSISDTKPSGTVPAAFKVPYKDEGPYVLMLV
ncbi:hypothetical protein BK003_01770 [bacterium CG09_39_24]|uniref:Uncharacterized protein n=2 Tax=Katanobacteria TaxID=422282 RepID=A0A2G9XCL5_UNCKA|nr:MAG: hypothetical protein BK003_01770 [bacterium CG09_39_24]PIP04702.1 MAG: hypothetical protein COX53_01050 [candidate division WWE3 bacterium CG23_combo_of_CG06-09_8_20_14_all_40_14]